MTAVRDFVAGLARAGKGFKEIQETVNAAYGDLALKRGAIYSILRKVKAGKNTKDQRHLNPKKTKRTAALIAAVAAAVHEDGRIGIQDLAMANEVSFGTIYNILHDDLGLVKKSARWVPKLLNEEQKQERVRTCTNFIAAAQRNSMAMLDRIITMDETMVSFHTPQTKKQSKQWIPKGQPGPIKARVHSTRTKQMVLAFFDAKGLVYTKIVPKGTKVNGNYIVKVLSTFMKQLKKKRPAMAAGEWFFHWDNAPVHTAVVVRNWLAAREVQVLEHPPYLPDLAPADFFYFPKVKEELAGLSLTQGTFRSTWERASRTIAKEEFAAAFQRWYQRCEKCVHIGGGYVEKS